MSPNTRFYRRSGRGWQPQPIMALREGWQPQPIMALRAILRLTELFAAGGTQVNSLQESINITIRHLRLRAKSQELRANLKSPPGHRRQK